MVSKIKRIPTKSIKPPRRRKSPIKHAVAISSTVLSSIHRHITNLFSKFTQFATPKRRLRGYRILKKKRHRKEQFYKQSFKSVRENLFSDLFLLPPLISPHRKTVFLDLDETLVHSKADPPPQRFDFVVRPLIDGDIMNFYVLKRPGMEDFLESLAAKYEVVVFTASLEVYASLVLDRVDPNQRISHRLHRDSCREIDGRLVKDLSAMGRDLKRVVIVDDNPNSYTKQPDNAIPIRPFIDDLGDQELWNLIRFFEVSDGCDDMRVAVKEYLSCGELTL
ncbi:hypothetical protein QN277_005856 [Acacia crassicarpa]|uniref:FCP1 homology domain-containing protein n=1 Tax=Acacia crassicarpa TaxID=499986 RepID=A0AAE1IY01_9FABA|nr:hypothetical protein QN277_005856 [Acacia crassicarpa]